MEALLKDVGVTEELFDQVHSYKGIKFINPVIDFNSIIKYLRAHVEKIRRPPIYCRNSKGQSKTSDKLQEFLFNSF